MQARLWLLAMCIVLLSLGVNFMCLGGPTTAPDGQGQPLFPQVTPENKELKDLTREVHLQSRWPQETEQEQALQLVDFSPLAMLQAVFPEERVPKDFADQLCKKRNWWPSEPSLDVVVGRFVHGGQLIQTVESRAFLVVFVRPAEGKLDTTPVGSHGLPRSLAELLRPGLFDQAKPFFNSNSRLKEGGTLELRVFHLIGPFRAEQAGPTSLTASVVWTDEALGVGMAKHYQAVASPHSVLNAPLFKVVDAEGG